MNKTTRYLLALILSLLPAASYAVERVVVTFPQSFGLVYIMGIADKVVGIPAQKLHIKDGKLGSFYSEYSPNLASATDVGFIGAVNMESLLKLQPDLVISSKNLPNVQDNNSFLRDHGVKVLEIGGRYGTVSDWLSLVKENCHAIGKPERAETYCKLYEKNLALVNERLAKIPAEKRVKVTLINSNGGEITIRGSRSQFTIELIKLAGGIVMEGEDTPQDTAACAELVFKFDPDVIIDDYSASGFAPDWIQYLRAVKNGRVYKFPIDDKQAWLTNWSFNVFSPLGLVWLAKSFYPEEFSDIDLTRLHTEFCQTILGR